MSARDQHRFGASPPLSLGVEEELLLVDGDGDLTCTAEDVLESVAGTPIANQVSVEIFTEQIELKTGICRDAGEVLEQLRELRRSLGEAFELLGCGLHPTAAGDEPVLVAKPRYEVVQKDLGSLLRTPPCGLHVHVGMPDPEAAVRLTNALRLYLPALQALSANSPFQEGVDSGHASARTQVVRSYPRFQVPRSFRDYADFLEVADQLVAAAGVDDYTYIWWDVRPHPSLGTVEVRAIDVPTEPSTSAAFAALIQAIAAKELDRPTDSRLHREAWRSPTSRLPATASRRRSCSIPSSPVRRARLPPACSGRSVPTRASLAMRRRWTQSTASCERATVPRSSAGWRARLASRDCLRA